MIIGSRGGKIRWIPRAIRLVNEVGEAGIRNLRFTGGEPFLRRDFFEVLKQSNTAPFKRIVVQTNGLLVKKLHKEINDSPITKIALSLDGMKETNDQVRGIKGYFDLGIEGLKLLRGKEIAISVTPNRMSAKELTALGEMADSVGANIEINILSRSLSFFKNADLDATVARAKRGSRNCEIRARQTEAPGLRNRLHDAIFQ